MMMQTDVVPRRFLVAVSALAAAQKSSVGAPAYSRFVNRPLGRLIAAAAYVVGLRPNAVTVISALLTLSGIAGIALLPPSPASAVSVTVLLVLGYATDSADGQVARLSRSGSVSGEWLDHVADAIKSSALHLAVLIAWFRFVDVPSAMLLIPIGYTLVSAVFFFGVILTEQLRRAHQPRSTASTDSASTPPARSLRSSPLYSLAVIPADYGFLCLAMLTIMAPTVFVVVYTVFFVANALILIASLVRWYRALSRLAPSS